MFQKYVKSNFKMLALIFLFLGIFAAVLLLFGLPAQATLYGALLCLIGFGVFLAVEYGAFRNRYQQLLRIAWEETGTAEDLPKAETSKEELYQELLIRAWEKRDEAVNESLRRQSDMKDYYSLWVHQIKTPIAAMRLTIQSESLPGEGELLEDLQRIEQYVEMVMGYTRLDSESSDYVIRSCSLDGIVRQGIRKYAGQFIRRRIALDYRETDCQVITDEKWLLFIIEQVLSNALKYTPEGGRIRICQETPGILCIEDTGIGIAAEDLPRVFEKGFTGYNGRADKKSTGIGLYLCRRIARRLGHEIRLESQTGKGTKVKIDLREVPVEAE